jgi:hypothetical protein
MNIDIIDNKVKEIKHPLSMLYCIFSNKHISDEFKSIVIRLFFKYHINIALECNLLEFNNMLENDYLTYNIIIDVYHIISRQILLIPFLHKFKIMYPNKYFWKLSIQKQIEYLNSLYTKFLCIFDGSKASFYFHIRLKNSEKNEYHINEILIRLKKIYDLFKYKFFETNNIILLSNNEFIDLTFENMIKYTEYIFNKINNILKQYILFFEIYNNYRLQLENIINPNNYINIDIIDVQSEMEPEDVNFILSVK